MVLPDFSDDEDGMRLADQTSRSQFQVTELSRHWSKKMDQKYEQVFSKLNKFFPATAKKGDEVKRWN